LAQFWYNEASGEAMLQRKRIGSADIAALLRREIVGGKLQLHDALPGERQLAETYGVSRGTVRQALARLEREKLVETRRGSGSYVVHSDAAPASALFGSARPLELIDARFALEPHICRLAVLHATPADFARAEVLLATMEASVGDPLEFSLADTRFHALLAESTNNALLVWMVAQINAVRSQEQWAHMRNITLNEAMITTYNEQHRAIFDAVRGRQPERAADLMKQHLETARLSLTRAAAT
jgi:DNA-binding FadR family transcriptional regulator